MENETNISQILNNKYYSELYEISNAPFGSFLEKRDNRDVLPNVDLIDSLVKAVYSLNSLEFMLFVNQFKALGINVPIDIKVGKNNERLFQQISLLFFIFSEVPKFKACCNLNTKDLYSILKDSVEIYDELIISDYMKNVLKFIEYNQNICLSNKERMEISVSGERTFNHYNTKDLILFYKYYANKYKHLILIKDTLDLFEIDRTENLEKLFFQNSTIERFFTVQIVDTNTQEEEAELKIKVTLEKNNEEKMDDINANFNVMVSNVECQVIQSKWKEKCFEDYEHTYKDKFVKGIHIVRNKKLITLTQKLIEMCTYNYFSLKNYQDFLKIIYDIYKKDNSKNYIIKQCEGIQKKVKCNNYFPTVKAIRYLCPACMEKHTPSTQYSRKSKLKRQK